MSLEVVVVGAGVMGAAVAAHLAEAGCKVTVLDARQCAAGTSSATFSWTNAGGKEPREYFELNVEGMRAHRRLARRVASCDWYHERGNLEWSVGSAARQDLQRKVTRLRDSGYRVRWLGPWDVRQLEPDMDEGMIGDQVAYYPEEGWVDAPRLVAALLASARAAGAVVRPHCAVAGLSMAGGRITGVATSDRDTVRADAVVNCAGPAADAIAGMAGVELPLRNTRGLLAYTTPAAVTVGRVIHAPRINLRPDGGGRLLLTNDHADAAVSGSAGGSAAPDAVAALLHVAGHLYPGVRGSTIEATRIGVRPIPADGLPVLGSSATVDNLHFAVTHSGVTLCLRVAELVGAEVRGDMVDQLAPFRHSRLDQRGLTSTPAGS
jgi:glycine/D-amino acid oxidase-like deaminating enzyme